MIYELEGNGSGCTKEGVLSGEGYKAFRRAPQSTKELDWTWQNTQRLEDWAGMRDGYGG